MDQSWSNLWICAWIRLVGVAGNLRKACCVHAESRVGFPPNTSQRRYLVQLSKRNSARTAASSSLKLGLANGLKFVEKWLLLFGLIRIKYLVELVGVAGPFPFCERHALIGWRPDWRQFKAGSSRCVTSGDRAWGRWEASVGLLKPHSEVRCEIDWSCIVRISAGTPADPDWSLLLFLPSLQAHVRTVRDVRPRLLYSISFLVHYSPSPNYSTLCIWCVACATDNVVK